MNKLAYIVIGLVVSAASYGQQQAEPGKLIRQDTIDGKKVCVYSDGSKITLKSVNEICPKAWTLLN